MQTPLVELLAFHIPPCRDRTDPPVAQSIGFFPRPPAVPSLNRAFCRSRALLQRLSCCAPFHSSSQTNPKINPRSLASRSSLGVLLPPFHRQVPSVHSQGGEPPFRPKATTLPKRSALAVSHDFSGLLHSNFAGLLHPAASHRVRHVSTNFRFLPLVSPIAHTLRSFPLVRGCTKSPCYSPLVV